MSRDVSICPRCRLPIDFEPIMRSCRCSPLVAVDDVPCELRAVADMFTGPEHVHVYKTQSIGGPLACDCGDPFPKMTPEELDHALRTMTGPLVDTETNNHGASFAKAIAEAPAPNLDLFRSTQEKLPL